jgi:hypothetical protein
MAQNIMMLIRPPSPIEKKDEKSHTQKEIFEDLDYN